MSDFQKFINWLKSIFPVFDEELARLKPVPTKIEILKEMIDNGYRTALKQAQDGLRHSAELTLKEIEVYEERLRTYLKMEELKK